ncbi:hypothetical protein BC936DRAFT_146452 [Jimgerdemannia flammicorona]|uniref:Uncharacterized protein n=1 Tax=Jimgerdemannia flammicorona TaxID=994334 RepID=A0A433D8B3_9FUNG|nr:hypothetical protein BC936DRAFT_146452 [Jimgerdemannia flammicorona]
MMSQVKRRIKEFVDGSGKVGDQKPHKCAQNVVCNVGIRDGVALSEHVVELCVETGEVLMVVYDVAHLEWVLKKAKQGKCLSRGLSISDWGGICATSSASANQYPNPQNGNHASCVIRLRYIIFIHLQPTHPTTGQHHLS